MSRDRELPGGDDSTDRQADPLLADHDAFDIAVKAGAMQLLPENADHYPRLLRISALAAANGFSATGRFRATDFAWRAWTNSEAPMAGAPEMEGDPPEAPFVAEVAFIGGGYLVFPADFSDDAYIVESLLAVISDRETNFTSAFRRAAVELALAGLWLSNETARRAGLSRGTESGWTENGEIRWPSGSEAKRLESAVHFHPDEVTAALRRLGVGDRGLRRLSFEPGQVDLSFQFHPANPMCHTPVLTTQDEVVVVAPTALLLAVRNGLFRLAAEHGVRGHLADEYRRAVARTVRRSARRLGWVWNQEVTIDCGPHRVEQMVFQFDDDKAAVAYVMADDLRDVSEEPSESFWNTEPLLEALEPRRREIEEWLLSQGTGVTGVLHVQVWQGIGRPYGVAGGETMSGSSLAVDLSADELEMFSYLNRSKPLALWQVASAADRLGDEIGIIGGFLDHYALYRARGHSYYFGDHEPPDVAFFSGAGLQVRLEVARQVDAHVVLSPQGGCFCRVVRMHQDPAVPIYAPEPVPGSPIGILVEGGPMPVWVTTPRPSEIPAPAYGQVYFYLADTIAYWIWQFTPSWRSLGARVDNELPHVEIRLQVVPGDGWFIRPDAPADSPGLTGRCDGPGLVTIEVQPDFAARAAGPDNSAERELAGILLRHLLMATAVGAGEFPSGAKVRDAVDRHAPLGPKRKLLIMQGELSERVDTDGLPALRLVQSFNEEELEDEIGRRLVERHGLAGPISESRRQKVFRDVVAELYGRLQNAVRCLSPDGLLERLVRHNERIIADRRLREHMLAGRLACFGNTEKNLREFGEELSRYDRTAMASRFLLEYVAASPPEGRGVLSLSAYDRLLALASEINRYGHLSDASHYGLSEHALELLKSGRLAVQDDHFQTAVARFRETFYRRLAAGRGENGAVKSRATSARGGVYQVEEIERVTRAEFGRSLPDLVDLLGTIAGGELSGPDGVGVAPVDRVIGFAADALHWPPVDVQAAMELFQLGSRDDFLNPPPPYSKADVFPWRFNRKLSYIRRPLLVRQSDGSRELVWGRRALLQASIYLTDLCLSGRLKNPASVRLSQFQTARAMRVFN